MNEQTEKEMQYNKNDEMNFVIENYGEVIQATLGTNEIAVSFFANSESYIDKIEPIKKPSLNYGDMKILIYQDFSIDKELLADCNICFIGDKKFLKIITPFTRERSYDFIIARYEELEPILKELRIRQEKANFTSVNLPIIGIDFESLKRETIDFLLNDDFRKFCIEHRIPLKRGIILEGKPGTGKTLSLKWLKEQALKNKIEFNSFRSPKEFQDEKERYFAADKKIFVFEDFDAMVMDRKKTDGTPNTILQQLLNTLEGVDEIKDVVSIFTTNHIDNFDSAFVRPGRIDKVISYSLPDEKNRRDFLGCYLEEFSNQLKDFIIDFLREKNVDVSYAILKGICDDINIYKFNGAFAPDQEVEIVNKTISHIIVEKLKGAQKGKEVKDTKSYTL
jgi:Cdc6-like AAA superfamily ATPase